MTPPKFPGAWLFLVMAMLSWLPVIATAQVAGYRLEPVHTRVLFAIDHAGYSQALGTVSGSTGMLAFDPEDWSSARLSVEVPLQRLDMGDPGWTRAVVARRFLDVARYPVATFVSNRIEPIDPTHARACGTLELHGVDHDLCMDVSFNKLKHYPLPPFRTTIGFSATATLKRSDFGITAWKSLVGDEVQLRIEAEAQRDGDALQAIDTNRPPAKDPAAPNRDEDAPAPPDEKVSPP